MSSSNVFKQDSDFTPTPLVQHELTLPLEPQEPVMEIEPVEPDPEPEENQTTTGVEGVEQPIVNEPQEPAVDLQALQEEAYAQGVHDATLQLESQILPAVEAFHLACQELDTQRHALMDVCRGEIINTVIALTKKIIGDELQTKRNVIANILEKALHQAISSEEFIVTVHPDDLEVVQEKQNDLITEIRGLEHLVIKTDNTISRGGCLLESNTCSIDATIESQLKNAGEFLEEHTGLPGKENDKEENIG